MGKGIMEEVVTDPEKYYAHVYENEVGDRKRETLIEHTALTENYFNRIWKEKLGGEMLLRMQEQFGSEISKEAEEFWRELIYNIPVFHDLGKINPAFQKDKMKNREIQDNGKLSSLVSSRHSLVSAFFEENKNFSKRQERKEIFTLLYIAPFLCARTTPQ